MEQPHAKWDTRCVGARLGAPDTEEAEAAALITTSSSSPMVRAAVMMMAGVTSLLTLT